MSDVRAVGPSGEHVELRSTAQGSLFGQTIPGGLLYLRAQQLSTSGTGAVSLTIPGGAVYAEVQVTAADIYYNYDNGSVTPASTAGMQAFIGDIIPIKGPVKMQSFRAVRQGSVNTTLNIFYYSGTRDE